MNESYFLCVKCRTPIAIFEACAFSKGPPESLAIFEDALVNVTVDGADKKWFEDIDAPPQLTYVQAYCNGCRTVLGKQMEEAFSVEWEQAALCRKCEGRLFFKEASNGVYML